MPIRKGDDMNIWVPDIVVINGTTDTHEELSESYAQIYPKQSPHYTQEDPPWNVFWSRIGTAPTGADARKVRSKLSRLPS